MGVVELVVDTSGAKKLGLRMQSKQTTVVQEVFAEGLIPEWNAKNGGVITGGAAIIDINGITGPAIHPIMRNGGKLTMKVELSADVAKRIAEEEKAHREAEEKAKTEREQKARREAEEKARKESEEKARREAEEKARKESEEKARREAEEKARKEREEKARREAEEKARKESEEKARREAEEKARKESEEKARREAEEKARKESEERARREAEEKARKEQEVQEAAAATLAPAATVAPEPAKIAEGNAEAAPAKKKAGKKTKK